MLVGLVVRTKVKKSQENSQAVRSEEDEPYEPPGLGDIIPAEPETPSPKDTSQPVEPLLGINCKYACHYLCICLYCLSMLV